MKQIEIYIDCYTFFIDVSRYFVQKPLGKWCDSDYDAMGYTDLEFEITSIEEAFDEDAISNSVAPYLMYSETYMKETFDLLLDEHYEEVYDRLLVKLEEEKNDDLG